MTATHIRFQVVKVKGVRATRCPKCGRKVYRQRTFEHTINPFNKNADGTVKSPEQVRADCRAEAAAWEHGVEPCATCKLPKLKPLEFK